MHRFGPSRKDARTRIIALVSPSHLLARGEDPAIVAEGKAVPKSKVRGRALQVRLEHQPGVMRHPLLAEVSSGAESVASKHDVIVDKSSKPPADAGELSASLQRHVFQR